MNDILPVRTPDAVRKPDPEFQEDACKFEPKSPIWSVLHYEKRSLRKPYLTLHIILHGGQLLNMTDLDGMKTFTRQLQEKSIHDR